MTDVSKSMLDQTIQDPEDKLRKEFEQKLLVKDNEFKTIKTDLEKKVTALELKVTILESNLFLLVMKILRTPRLTLLKKQQVHRDKCR